MRCILHFSSVQGTSAGDLSLKVFEISVISAYILLVFFALVANHVIIIITPYYQTAIYVVYFVRCQTIIGTVRI